MKDAGCKQHVYWWTAYIKVVFPPLVTGKESTAPEKRLGWDGSKVSTSAWCK